MPFPAQALQAAVYSALDSALSVSVYDHVPPAQTDQTYVTIGDDTAIDWSDKTKSGVEATITIHAWDSSVRGRKGVKNLQSQIYDALHEKNLSISGFTTVDVRFDYADSFLDEDGLTYHGPIRFRVLVDGA